MIGEIDTDKEFHFKSCVKDTCLSDKEERGQCKNASRSMTILVSSLLLGKVNEEYIIV